MAEGAQRAWALFRAGETVRAAPTLTKKARKRMADAASNRWKKYRAEKSAIAAGELTDEQLDHRALATMPWRAIEEKKRVVSEWKETAVGSLFRGPVVPPTFASAVQFEKEKVRQQCVKTDEEQWEEPVRASRTRPPRLRFMDTANSNVMVANRSPESHSMPAVTAARA